MGACLSSPGDAAAKAKSKTPSEPFSVTVAFPNVLPHSLTVSPTDRVAHIRASCVAEMQRRHGSGEDFVHVDGKLMTLNPDTGDPVNLADALSVNAANLEPKQYLWFHDESENTREADLILRSSRLTENRSHNSRGVKAGMAEMRADDAMTA